MSRTLLLVALVVSCAKPAPPPAPSASPPPAPPPAPQTPAYAVDLLAAMDPSADPCTDFYQYACGSWIKNTPLPSDKPAWARSFSVIADRNREALKGMLEAAAAEPGTDPDHAKMGHYFKACMDEPAIEAKGLAALGPLRGEIAKVKDPKSFMRMTGAVQAAGAGALFSQWTDGDYKDPATNIWYLSEGGLGLPDKDYYLPSDDGGKQLLAAYEAHIAAVLGIAGVEAKEAASQAKAIVALETALAEAWVPRAELRDPDKTYHKIDRAGLKKLTPKLDWDAYFEGFGAPHIQALSVEPPEVFQKFERIVKATPIGTLRAYLDWQLIHAYASQGPKALFDANFAFYGQQVTGQKEPEVRWKRCTRITDTSIGEITGRYWVREKFPGESKDVALGMIKDIEDAFSAGLPRLEWMDDSTRERAVGKVAKITNKIGFPDRWRDYSALAVTPDDHLGNVLAARRFENAREAAKVAQPAPRDEWFMSAPTVNAYYNATLNEMVFPAGILQPPFFSKDFPAAMNYGAIGMVMGHELSHGFDDQGRKFDGDGKMSEWWAPEVAQKYEARAACVESQYSDYAVPDGTHVKGDLTLGENIADLGGMRLAFRAFKAKGAPPANVPGLTDDQLYFVAAAQGWCQVASPQYVKMLISSDSHSPARFRVNGPMSNLTEFRDAFSCTEGREMVRKERCEVW